MSSRTYVTTLLLIAALATVGMFIIFGGYPGQHNAIEDIPPHAVFCFETAADHVSVQASEGGRLIEQDYKLEPYKMFTGYQKPNCFRHNTPIPIYEPIFYSFEFKRKVWAGVAYMHRDPDSGRGTDFRHLNCEGKICTAYLYVWRGETPLIVVQDLGKDQGWVGTPVNAADAETEAPDPSEERHGIE